MLCGYHTKVIVSGVLLFFPSLAYAENPSLRQKIDGASIISLSIENNFFTDKDGHYTNGVRLAYISPEGTLPKWLQDSAIPSSFPGHKRWYAEIGQSIFTPGEIELPQLLVNDRPYAGWLYGSMGMLADTGSQLNTLQLTLGVVGPASGAKHSQRKVHHILDLDEPRGWANQLENEPGIVLSYEHKWRNLYEFPSSRWGMDAIPSIGASVGNIYTHAGAGAMVRFGYGLPSDYGAPLIRPNISGADMFVPTKDFGWYMFAGVEGRAVARNIFLDGNTFTDSHSVDKRHFVGGIQAGIAFTIKAVRLAYTHNFLSKEFKGQEGGDDFDSINISWRY